MYSRAPGPPTYGLRVPASCAPYVYTEGAGQLAAGPQHCRTYSTRYTYQPRPCRTHVPRTYCGTAGSTHAGLDGYACPELCWLGLVASDVLAPMPRSLFSGSRADAERTLPPEDFQPFTPRDRSVLEGLRQRSAVRKDGARAPPPPNQAAPRNHTTTQPHNHTRRSRTCVPQ